MINYELIIITSIVGTLIAYPTTDYLSEYTLERPFSCLMCMSFWITLIITIIVKLILGDSSVLISPFLSYFIGKVLSRFLN